MRRFVLLVAALYGGLAIAQDTPLTGPLLATTNAAQDAVIIIDTATGALREFSVGDGVHTVWDFAPDGCRILVTLMDADGLASLVITSLDGSTITEPVQYDELPPAQWGIWEPDWSPDGARIAFRMARDGFDGEIERQYHVGWVPPEGGAPTFYSVSGREHSPRWSPDGAWLAYVSYDKRAPGADDQSTAEPTAAALTAPESYIQEADLWVVSADASEKYRMTAFSTGSVRSPRWSPDGRAIAFVYAPSPSNDTYWVVTNEPRARPLQVTYGYSLSLDLQWTPDGDLLASARGLNGRDSQELWRIPASAGADALARPFFDATPPPYADYPAFNDDGTLLALRSAYRATVADIDSGEIRSFEGAESNMPLIWSPAAFTGEGACERAD